MKRKIAFWIICSLFFVASSASAQMPTGQWYVIHSEIVKPSMVKEYEAAAAKFVALVKANQATMPHFYFVGLQFDDFTYSYVVPVTNMASIDQVNQDFMSMMKSPAGAEFMENVNRGNAAVEYIRETVYGEAPELSYAPAAPRLKPEEELFFHYDLYYVKPDKGMDAEAIAKDFMALFKKKSIPDGYKIYLPVMAPEMPVIVVRSGARDEADFHATQKKNMEILGAEGKALFDRAFAVTRRFEQRTAKVRLDLSVLPPAK